MDIDSQLQFRPAFENDLSQIAQLYVDVFEGPFLENEKGLDHYQKLLHLAHGLLHNHFIAKTKFHFPLDIFVAVDLQKKQDRYRTLFRSKTKGTRVVGAIEVGYWAKEQFQIDEPLMFFANLIVDRDYRRKGIASRLIRLSEEFVHHKHNLSSIHTAVITNNTDAISLYSKCGYVIDQQFQLPEEFHYVTIMTKKF